MTRKQTKRKKKFDSSPLFHVKKTGEVETLDVSVDMFAFAKYLEDHYPDGKVNNDNELLKFYNGKFFPYYYNHKVEGAQIWRAEINVEYKNEGDEHPLGKHILSFDDMPFKMTFSEYLEGCIKVINGESLEWDGLVSQWIKEVDSDLGDYTTHSVHAVIYCDAEIYEVKTSNSLVNNFMVKSMSSII